MAGVLEVGPGRKAGPADRGRREMGGAVSGTAAGTAATDYRGEAAGRLTQPCAADWGVGEVASGGYEEDAGYGQDMHLSLSSR